MFYLSHYLSQYFTFWNFEYKCYRSEVSLKICSSIEFLDVIIITVTIPRINIIIAVLVLLLLTLVPRLLSLNLNMLWILFSLRLKMIMIAMMDNVILASILLNTRDVAIMLLLLSTALVPSLKRLLDLTSDLVVFWNQGLKW